MILSGRDVEHYLQYGLKIEPCTPDQFQQNGVDFVLEEVVDEGGYPVANFNRLNFYLGTTREYIEMPNDVMAFVELRSTWARHGLVLPPTIIDAGFKGTITLEIVAFKNLPVPRGERFAHLIFAKMTSPSIPYNGKYQHQRGVTGPIRDKK